MNQARGRYAGSRDSGQRQARQEKKSQPKRPGQPYVKAPAQDSTQTASIFKTRSFQFLVDTVGAENIAIALESSMTRVAELMKGERFTPETAFHMETTLGLPHGFFDQPNPGLAAETIARLKSPLDFIQPDDEPDGESEALKPASVLSVDPKPSLEDSLSEEAQMPRKAAGGTPRAVKTSRGDTAGQPEARTPRKASRSKSRTSPEAAQQQSLALNDGVDVENIRRANLHVLTSRNGSKARLGVVMELSGSNMAHRLHGKKRLDAVEANRFTERLGLPAGWLDTPRSEADIPASVSRMLAPAARSRVSAQQHESLAPATNEDMPVKAAGTKARARRAQASDPEGSTVSADVAGEKEAIVTSARDHVNGFPDDVTGQLPEEGGDGAPAAIRATPESFATSAVPQRNPAALPFASVTSLDNLHGIEPIAEALIKTLAGKARTGRLDELKALELLQQAILL
ncbi:hypothetical protein E1N52_38890 [Paraburkholderia guartelaensis]|uniref:Uncharacterized protein n=1 Tax=Paraburkholderia guartelaensis TaxID=2546446 RepID=A0A4R5L4V2_9BURK|nr:hypothetical protein [Paraburkholderia guartelaensis]TDG02611.1 hypothetical protein E1N52_38890 [Paraburkholderia guartelaensis]